MSIMPCSVPQCERPRKTRGWCGTHYSRWLKYGTVDDPLNTCGQCGLQFRPFRRASKFCSNSCSNAWSRKNNSRKCTAVDCGRPYDAAGLCTIHYRRKARADGRELNPKWDDRRRANYHKRRALKAETAAEDFSPAAVFERDGWVCGICSEPVAQDLAWPHQLSPSLDHILPLSKGGHHTLENTQLAHLQCNVRKGARVEDLADAMPA